jgi:magnesium transporter
VKTDRMDAEQPLTLAFLRSHPVRAAQVLEALPAAEAAALFERVPARLGATVLAAMLPQRAARIVETLDDARALELLSPMATQPTVVLLRHLPETRRRHLIAGLPTAAALASTLLLGFTDDSLGAWVDPDVTMLGADTRAAAALERLRLAPSGHALVFVTDAERRLVGSVSLDVLLRAPAAASLATLMQRPVAVLLAQAPLAGTAAHPGWELASLLPVVESGERLVGVMTRDALARALGRAQPAPALAAAPSLPVLFARGYWQALTGLLGAGLALLPRVAPLQDAGRGAVQDVGRAAADER